MKRCLWLVILVAGWLWPGIVWAVNLEEAVVRLERSQTGVSPLPILVELRSSSVAVENGVRVQLGQAWRVEGEVTADTVALPSGVTPLPGLNTTGSVDGQKINFTSSDLEIGKLYGFYIRSGISQNQTMEATNYKWQLATLSGGEISEEREVKVAVVASDQIQISGQVGALASDFQLEIGSDKVADLGLDEVVTYEIKYGSYLKTTVKPLVITANWSRGTVAGSNSPSVDIVDYVIGSGSTAWGGVLPVIDVVNRKISWTISSFPAETNDQRVTFKLKTNDQYSGQSKVKFEVEALLSGANVVTTSAKVSNYFQGPLLPTATPVPESEATGLSPTPSPMISQKIRIEKVSMATITDKNAGILVETNIAPAEIKVKYGKQSLLLNGTILSLNALKSDLIRLDSLLPGSDYFFRVEAKGSDGSIFMSDIFYFRTAESQFLSSAESKSLIMSVDDNIILDAGTEEDSSNSVVVVPGQNYAFRIKIEKAELVKRAQVLVRNSQVLGINSVYGAEPNSMTVDLLELSNGAFIGHLVSPKGIGLYDLVLRIEGSNGSISENKIGIIRVVDFLRVEDESLRGIENAKVVLYRFIPKKQIFELVSQQTMGIRNPNYTEADGTLALSLSKGRYRSEVSAIGFESASEDFVIGMSAEEKLPRIVLKKTKNSWSGWWDYYSGTGGDVWNYTTKYFSNLGVSKRFFDLSKVLIIIVGVVAWWRFWTRRVKSYWWLLGEEVIYRLKNRFKKRDKNLSWGKVVDKETLMPVAEARVYLLDDKKKKVLEMAMTNTLGNFEIKIAEGKKYRLAVAKDGYTTTDLRDYSYEGLAAGKLRLELENFITTKEKIQMVTAKAGNRIWYFGMIFVMVCLLFLEFYFEKNFHFDKSIWWILMTIINLAIWIKG